MNECCSPLLPASSKHMKAALDSLSGLDEDSKDLLTAFFSHTAFFLVAGKHMMNPGNLVDYHNKMAESSGTESPGKDS